MSFKAVLQLEDQHFNLIHVDFEFHQQTNKDGYPGHYPSGGVITLSVESSADTTFIHWALSSTQKKSGKIIFYNRDHQSKLKELIFADGYCINFREKFSHNSPIPMFTEIKISAGWMKMGLSEFKKPWLENTGMGSEEGDGMSTSESGIQGVSNQGISEKEEVPVINSQDRPTNTPNTNEIIEDNSFETHPMHQRLVSNGVKFKKDGDKVSYITHDGEEFCVLKNGEFKVTKDKSTIPPPKDYKDFSMVEKQKEEFRNVGASFIAIKSWTEGGNPLNKGLPKGKFVGLKPQMDSVIERFRSSGNDWRILRDELNLGPDTDLSDEEIIYIKIDGNDPNYTFEMPSGNEPGAIEGEWMPCGQTKNGIKEAALIGSEKVLHNKDINKLISCFGTGNCTKIK